jgi:peroxiredoxin
MAQLRQDHQKFVEHGAVILCMGPDGPNAFKRYWQTENIPFIGLPDIKNRIADLYHQEVNLFKLGRMPAIFVVDLSGMIVYSHFGESMSDIPENEEILKVLDSLA